MSVAAPLQAASDTPKRSSLSVGARLLQRKLIVGASNDPLEREADWVADSVMSVPEHRGITNASLHIQRIPSQIEVAGDVAPASVERTLVRTGTPLEAGLRMDMEERFGYDFSQVRVHFGDAAEQSTRDVDANAYTVGRNIVFGRGKYAPATEDGRRRIAHELTHVVQQSDFGTSPQIIRRSQGTGGGPHDEEFEPPFAPQGVMVQEVVRMSKSNRSGNVSNQNRRSQFTLQMCFPGVQHALI